MESLILKATDDTPEIIFNKDEGIFSITGKSLPEDVIEFYTPVFSWLEKYVADALQSTVFTVKIVYFNSASQRALNEIFTILCRLGMKDKQIEVAWYFHQDDEEIQEAGEEYADITQIPFRYISYAPE